MAAVCQHCDCCIINCGFRSLAGALVVCGSQIVPMSAFFYEDTKYTKTKSSLSLQCGTEMRARAFFLSLGKTDYFGPFLNFVDFTTQDCHGDIFAL